MSDPFANIFPTAGRTQTVIVHEQKQNQTFMAWRVAHVAMPDLHIVDRKQPLPEPIADDGKPLTMERIRALMGDDVKPMFEASPDGDNRKAKPTGQVYTDAFDDRLEAERIGSSAEARRPAMRIVPPVEPDLSEIVRADRLALPQPEGTLPTCPS